MRRLLAFAFVATLVPLAGAEVIRCADASGNVSYTDGACPAGARQVGRVTEPEPARPGPELPALPPQREPTEAAAARPPPTPSGPIIIDSRGGNPGERPGESRRSDRGVDDPAVADYGYPYPGGGYRPTRPQRDLRPRITNCDAGGCRDTQGNHYNPSGQLDRYRGIDGRTCQPVGTTTVCR